MGSEIQGKTADWIVTNFQKRHEKFQRIAPENECVPLPTYLTP